MSHSTNKVFPAIADRECQKICRGTIRVLQGMGAANTSELVNTWNEVCVQVQGHESAFWDMYLDTITQIILGYVSKLPVEMKQAIWLQTQCGEEWESENDDNDGVLYSDDDIAEYICHDYVLAAASTWTSEPIQRYLGE